MTDVAQAVIEALSTCPGCTGWGSLDAAAVTVKDISGYGGSKTYSVTAPEGGAVVATPAKVCYHKLCEDSVPMEGRMKTAQDVLSEAGLAPKRLVTSPGSYVETFTETSSGDSSEERTVATAKLLARIHQVPTDWFDAQRAAVHGANPRLAEAAIPLNSHLWLYSARNVLPGANATAPSNSPATPDATKQGSENWPPEAFRNYADLGAAMPHHPAAKRLVTIHGDFHNGNVLYRTEEQGGPLACDFEFVSAGAAVWDLSYHLASAHMSAVKGHTPWSTAHRQIFLKTYLLEMGENPEDPGFDYDMFEADVALGMFPFWNTGYEAFPGWNMGGTTGAAMCSPSGEPARVNQFAAEFRASAALRQQASCSETGAVQVYQCLLPSQPTPETRTKIEDPAECQRPGCPHKAHPTQTHGYCCNKCRMDVGHGIHCTQHTASSSSPSGNGPTESLLEVGGLYEIEPCHAPGMRIGVTGGRNKNGSKLQQWPSDGSNAQKFRVRRHGGGEYYVFEALCAPSRAIDNCGGCKIPCHLWEHFNLGNDNTHWKLEAAKDDGCFSVIARPHGGHRWDIEGASKDEGAKLRTWSNEEEEGANAGHQKFKFIPTVRKAFDGLEAVRVDFSDPSRPSEKLLSEFSAKFEVNKVTAMVGSGSTTAMHLLLGFYEPNAGQIVMPGEPEHKVVVSQETSLLLAGATIEESITSGIPGYTQQALLEAARSAHALEFIQGLPDGFQTTVGRGVSLSGSQKQRLAIARAILRKPTLLIVDEASSSALDSESSEEVQALDNLMDGVGPKCTVIVLAHRLSTLTKADTVLVLADGAVVEQGAHPELLQQSGVYANLIAHQLQQNGLSSSSSSSAGSQTPPPQVL